MKRNDRKRFELIRCKVLEALSLKDLLFMKKYAMLHWNKALYCELWFDKLSVMLNGVNISERISSFKF